MEKEKLLKLLKEEFSDTFGIFTENNDTELYLVDYLGDYAAVEFKITQKYLLSATIIEFPFLETRTRIRMLPSIKLETEEQVVQLIKTGYDYFQTKYKIFNVVADCMTKGMISEANIAFDVVL